jgi:hypothetical protein
VSDLNYPRWLVMMFAVGVVATASGLTFLVVAAITSAPVAIAGTFLLPVGLVLVAFSVLRGEDIARERGEM